MKNTAYYGESKDGKALVFTDQEEPKPSPYAWVWVMVGVWIGIPFAVVTVFLLWAKN